MVFEGTRHGSLQITCSCGCGEGLEFQLAYDEALEEPFVWIRSTQLRRYTEPNVGLHRLAKKVKKTWAFVWNKDYSPSEWIMETEAFDAFCTLLGQAKK